MIWNVLGLILLPPCASNLKWRSKGELTVASGEVKITLGLRVMPRVTRLTPAVVGGGGSEASSCLMSTLAACAALPISASVSRHEAKTADFMVGTPNCGFAANIFSFYWPRKLAQVRCGRSF